MEISGSNFSETDASNNNASPNGAPEGMSPAGVNDTIRAVMGAVKRFWGRIQGANASTGSSNAYVLSPTVDLAAYVTGERYSFRANFANTGSATLNISSLGAKTIKKMTGAGKAALISGDIQNGQPVTVEYDGTDLVLVTPSADQGAAVLLGTQTASAGSAISFTSGIGTSYDLYMIDLQDIVPGTDNVALLLQISTDGGGTWKNSTYQHVLSTLEATGASTGTNTTTGSNSTTAFTIAASLSSTASEGLRGQVYLSRGASAQVSFRSNASFIAAAGNFTGASSFGTQSNSSFDAIRILPGIGTISGTARLYGFKK